MPKVWLNGQILEAADAKLPLRDPGLLHAAGVFTTMRSRAFQIIRLPEHLTRIRHSCQALFIPIAYTDQQITEAAATLLKENNFPNARLRLTITAENTFLTATAFQPYPAQLYTTGMTVALLDEQKLNPFDIQAGHKTLNYFSRLAALRHGQILGCSEALWFNIFNYLQSGSISNIFLIKSGQLFTPPTQSEIDADAQLKEKLPYARSNVLPGITRAAVLEIAQAKGLAIDRQAINVEQLLDADEIFLTNSIMGIMPVTRIERSVVGNDKPGEITLQLSEALND